MESHLEARLWNEVFLAAQAALGIPKGTIRATVLIETLPAAFRMNEILWELRDHSAGLNCGRWDYIFSFIKTARNHPPRAAGPRSGRHDPALYAWLLASSSSRPATAADVHAMGGMAAQIPIKNDPAANEARAREGAARQAARGRGRPRRHLGRAPGPGTDRARRSSTRRWRDRISSAICVLTCSVGRAQLLELPTGTRTEAGLRQNVRVGVQYLEAWLRGSGCVPLYNLMEDAATAEISRTQVWQWLRHGARLDDGRVVTRELVEQMLDEELQASPAAKFDEARRLFLQVATSELSGGLPDACPATTTA